MKLLSLFILFIFSSISFADDHLCHTDILNERKLNEKNIIDNYKHYDFANLWLKTDTQSTFGIIGDEHLRLRIKLITVVKNSNNPNEYLVYGKSKVKDQLHDFVGKIRLAKIQAIEGQNYGVDDEYQNAEIKIQALITAQYEFFENKNQQLSGYFSGQAQSFFYIDRHNRVTYNDINSFEDGYFNNSFIGTWKMYNSKIIKIAHWADYRVPNSNCDFDIGAGEMSISQKYINRDWAGMALGDQVNDENILVQPIKKWWE